jgi:hypothetical protein
MSTSIAQLAAAIGKLAQAVRDNRPALVNSNVEMIQNGVLDIDKRLKALEDKVAELAHRK